MRAPHPNGGQDLVHHHLLDGTRVPTPGRGPVRGDQPPVDQEPPTGVPLGRSQLGGHGRVLHAPPIGLLLLGLVFNNTPIELRYLSFGAPFIALLIAWVCGRPRPWRRPLFGAIGAVQLASIFGLALAPTTMQPARAAARAAAPLVTGAVVFLPRGNDGVGIVGAFGCEAPPSLPLLVVGPADTPADIQARAQPYRRVILVLLGQDRESNASLPAMRLAFSVPGWHVIGGGSNIAAYERE